MVLIKTPLRIPLAGGLTDLKGYADRFGGVTISATIDKYIFVAIKRTSARYSTCTT
jgi:galactokinase/mevalonate kinase-like predicted kinase